MTKLYFSHPVSDFNTVWEAEIVRLLSGHYEVVNPNSIEHQAGYKEKGFRYTKEVRATCDAIVFIRFPSGRLGAGVATEVADFRKRDLPVWELTPIEERPGTFRIARSYTAPIDALDTMLTREETGWWKGHRNGGRGTPLELVVEQPAEQPAC